MLVCPPGDHEYVNVPVPPEPVTVAEPVAEPVHSTLSCYAKVAVGALALFTLTDPFFVQPLPSVTLTV